MKRLLLSISLFFLLSLVIAQPSLKVLDQYGNDITGSSITIYSANKLTGLLESHLKVQNSGDTDLNVLVRKVDNFTAGTATNSFCFGVNCYPPETDTSTDFTFIPSGGLNESFLGDYYPNNSMGISSVTYEFFDYTSTPIKIAASVTVIYAVSEVIDIFDEEGNRVNDGVVVVHSTDTSAAAYLDTKLKVKNNTSQELFMYARRVENSIVPGSTNTFCYGVCYPPDVDTSFVVVSIPAGAVDSNFVADYTPAGNAGATSLTFDFFDNYTLGEPVTASVTIIFNLSGVGIPEWNSNILGNPFPNPTSQYSSFNYNLPSGTQQAFIQVRNLQGVEVTRADLGRGPGKAVMDTSRLPGGIYIYSLIVDGQTRNSGKLIVKH